MSSKRINRRLKQLADSGNAVQNKDGSWQINVKALTMAERQRLFAELNANPTGAGKMSPTPKVM